MIMTYYDSTVHISGLDKKIVQQLDSVLIDNLDIDPDALQVLQAVTNPVKLSHLVKKAKGYVSKECSKGNIPTHNISITLHDRFHIKIFF